MVLTVTVNPTAKLHVNGTVAIGSSLYDSNGDTGTEGQVLSSVPGIGVSWTDQTGGSGGGGEPVGTRNSSKYSNWISTLRWYCSRTPELAAITGTNVPDLRERFIVGAGGDNSTVTDTAGYTVNATGGANTVTLSLNQIPAHTHQYNRANQRCVSYGVLGAEVINNNFQTTGSAGGVLMGIQLLTRTFHHIMLFATSLSTLQQVVLVDHQDKISEGNTEAEVVDTNGNGHFKVTTEGTERLRVTSNGSVGIGTIPNVAVDSTNTAKCLRYCNL